MCWNCGCMKPDEDHGNPDNITTESLRKAGIAGGPDTIKKMMSNFNDIYKAKIQGTAVDTRPVKK
jgi:hypothetical protein